LGGRSFSADEAIVAKRLKSGKVKEDCALRLQLSTQRMGGYEVKEGKKVKEDFVRCAYNIQSEDGRL
jgi:hypothetical protein